MNSLTFALVRAANLLRLPQFTNRKGEPAHSKPDGSDWTRADWAEAVTGEWGEYCNASKKFRRGDFTPAEFQAKARQELADTVIYLDLLAHNLGIDLGQAVVDTFNAVSQRVGSNVELDVNGLEVYMAKRLYKLGSKCDGGHEAPACADSLCRWRHPLNADE